MMYGHVDAPIHWVRHLRLLREIQERSVDSPSSSGCRLFTTTPRSTSPGLPDPVLRSGRTSQLRPCRASCCTVRSTIFRSRGSSSVRRAVPTFAAGANDLGGTLMERPSRGWPDRSSVRRPTGELVAIASIAGRPARQRTTTYRDVETANQEKRSKSGKTSPDGHSAVMLPTLACPSHNTNRPDRPFGPSVVVKRAIITRYAIPLDETYLPAVYLHRCCSDYGEVDPSDNTQLNPQEEIAVEDFDRLPLEDAEELGWQEKALCAETDPEAFSLRRADRLAKPRRSVWRAKFGSSAWITRLRMTNVSESGADCQNVSAVA